MTNLSRAFEAYSKPISPTRTTRDLEYKVLARITHKLKAASEEPNTKLPVLAKALHENRRLWSAFAVDVANERNMLPVDVRARILYLAEFTWHQTSLILQGKASCNDLISVNMSILRGLKN